VLEQYPNDVKLVFKNFPLTRIHKAAMNAAIGSLAANQQGKFWEFHALLFKNYSSLSDAKFDEFAQSLGLDMKQFKEDMKNPALAALVQRFARRCGSGCARHPVYFCQWANAEAEKSSWFQAGH
jgi:protein-disulfide isomerase